LIAPHPWNQGEDLKKKEDRNRRLNRRHIVRFLLLYLGLTGLSLFLIGYEPAKRILDLNGAYTGMVVKLTAMALKPFGIVKGVSGSILSLENVALDIRFGCNGLEAFIIYTVAVLAFPAAFSKKVQGILGGFLVLQAVNIARIVGLSLSAIYLRAYFETLHIYVAQGVMIAVAIVMFLFYLGYAAEK
jgi:exosortase/archaeosortase family protein